ncbi:metal ABC transporter permease [Nitratifractor sp.]
MIEALHYGFVQNALIAGILVSLIAGFVGSLVVVNRMVFLAGGIAHSSYGGVGLAIFLGIPIFWGAGVFSVAVALLLAWMTYRKTHLSDTWIGAVWAAGMALGVVLIDRTPGYHGDLMSYLFGSILAVERGDLGYMAALLVAVILLVHLRYRELLAVSYDPEYAELRGIPTRWYYTMLLILAALTVVVAIKVVGLILVIALLSIPTHIARRHSASLYTMMLLSSALALGFTLAGLVLSYRFDLSSGATIVLVSAAGLVLDTLIFKRH